ncbi:hypothetical protein GGF46_001896 [Coemansia sp. RSA 552]|nr:hypothetical protein GGF46_001896 [Coemansia sp. RSA 552]
MAVPPGSDGLPPVTGPGHVSVAGPSAAASLSTEVPERPATCRFFGQENGCRAGDDCRFLHIAGPPGNYEAQSGSASRGRRRKKQPARAQPEVDDENGDEDEEGPHPRGRGKGRARKGKGRQATDTLRKRQIDDLLRAPQWLVKRLVSDRGETALAVEMKPSDPDFPFDVSRLYMALVIPALYPAKRTSDRILRIEIANRSIPTGVKHNIETTFTKHVRKTVNAAIKQGQPEGVPSLEDYLHWLDRNLELTMQLKPAPTIKFTKFAESEKASEAAPQPEPKEPQQLGAGSRDEGRTSKLSPLLLEDKPPPTPVVSFPDVPAAKRESRPPVRRPVPKPLQNAQATSAASEGSKSRRAMELGQLERRFRGSYSTVRDTPENGTVVSLDITPTDPDIHAFDIFQLTATITLLPSYPELRSDGTGHPQSSVTLVLDDSTILGRKDRPSTWMPASGRKAFLAHVSSCFGNHVVEAPSTSLLHHLNWLDRQLVRIISGPLPEKPQDEQVPVSEAPVEGTRPARLFEDVDQAKPWIKHISPHEAGLPDAVASLAVGVDSSDATSGSGSELYSSDDDDDDDGDGHGASGTNSNTGGQFSKPVRRGIEMRFGMVTLTGVSLAFCHSLNLSVRCGRCKNTVEVKGIMPTTTTDRDHQMWKACDTCSTVVGVRFRPDWMVGGSTTLGYLDCSGCAPVDLLPSKFTLACESCATRDMSDHDSDGGNAPESQRSASEALGTVGIASPAFFNCHACYARLGMHVQEPQFVQLQSGLSMGGASSSAQISKEVERTCKKKINKREELARLGVVPGEPLPKNGTCKHFGRSHRWMRFPCCGKTFPCVTCHDDKEDHSSERAQSMLCGFCAKEQRISKAERTGQCVGCGAQVIKKVDGNNAFWQGGKGVRDRTKMNRRDPKKFQGLNKTVAQKKVGVSKK